MDPLMTDTVGVRSTRPFNTPMELGMRCLFLLEAVAPRSCDLQRLVHYDYLLVHSDDFEDAPRSLHAHLPNRAGEWLVRRERLNLGLDLMCSRELLDKRFDTDGIRYAANELTPIFLTYFESGYAAGLRDTAMWVNARFGALQDEELRRLLTTTLGAWVTEYDREIGRSS